MNKTRENHNYVITHNENNTEWTITYSMIKYKHSTRVQIKHNKKLKLNLDNN